jgi:hypothetical protein
MDLGEQSMGPVQHKRLSEKAQCNDFSKVQFKVHGDDRPQSISLK